MKLKNPIQLVRYDDTIVIVGASLELGELMEYAIDGLQYTIGVSKPSDWTSDEQEHYDNLTKWYKELARKI